MIRTIRCQAAIIYEDNILLVKHKNHKTQNIYWWLPGGCIEKNETKKECVKREIKEETNLDVKVKKLLFEEKGRPKYDYEIFATYLCEPVSNNVEIGTEKSDTHSIINLKWFKINDETDWEIGLYEEHIFPLLKKIREIIIKKDF